MRKAAATRGDVALLALGGVALAAYALLYAGPYALRVMTVAGAYALAVIGYQIIFGLCGALSLAQGAFFGVGAYVSGVLALKLGWDFAATAPLAVLAPTLLAALVGAAVLRLESHYFALATLGVAQVVLLAVVNGPAFLGGANGLAGVPGVVLFGVPVARGLPLALLAWGLVAIVGVAAAILAAGRFGRSLVLAREDPLTAACLGLDVARMRLQAFMASAALAGLGGALAVHAQRVVSPEALEFPVMVTVLTMAVVGGRSRVAGAVVGALLLTWLPEWLGGLGQARLLFYGGALLIAIILFPEGAAGALVRLGRFGGSPLRSSAASAAVDWPRRCGAVAALGLTKSFGGVRAVDGVSFDIRAGEIVGLIGPNGSGKTTLINLLSGIERADEGQTLLNGFVAPSAAYLRARSGMARTFQNPILTHGVDVRDAVAAAAYADGVSVEAARARIAPLLESAALRDVARDAAAAVPLGVRRRVDLTRALARQPSVLLLDEPAAGLTADERATTAALIRAVAASGVAVLIVEHDMEFLGPLCGRTLCMDRGRLIYDGPSAGLKDDPAVRAAYFGGAR